VPPVIPISINFLKADPGLEAKFFMKFLILRPVYSQMIRSDLRFQVVTKKRFEISFPPFRDYPEIAKKVIKEMHRQVGDLVFNESGTFHLNCAFCKICEGISSAVFFLFFQGWRSRVCLFVIW
jgi:hypothetical protein